MILRSLAASLVACSALLLAADARADVFTVTTTADTPGAAGCTVLQCTLRNAIAAATGNGNTADDEVVLLAGTYELVQGTLNVPSGATRVTVRGAGANVTAIRPNIEFPARVLTIGSTAGLRLVDLSLRSGRAPSGPGGNVQVDNGATLELTRVRIFDGQAQLGGGIGALGPASLTIAQSLIDGNRATGAALTDIGGGLYLQGQTSATPVSITDSTILGNSARNGAGIGMTNNTGQPPALRGVTLARNTARAGAGGIGVGGIYSQNTNARFQGSIVAGNTSTFNTGPGPVTVPANCALASAATDEGGNLESEADCGFAGRQNTDPQLAADLDGSQPPVLAIPASSPAVDAAECGGRTVDQRGAARPQLARCDAGAYEYQPPPVEPTPTPAPTITPVPTPTATPTPVPTPVVNRIVVAEPARGTVLVRRPGTSRYVKLDGAAAIPVGSTVDARKGEVFLTSIPRAGAKPERAKFWAGIFRISQSRGVTTLALTEQLAPCSSRARAAQSRKPKTRKLWGDGKGRFRTKGRYAAATVRGTRWLVTDGCRYTRTRVTQGSVSVRDEVRERTVIVRKGRSYTARARR